MQSSILSYSKFWHSHVLSNKIVQKLIGYGTIHLGDCNTQKFLCGQLTPLAREIHSTNRKIKRQPKQYCAAANGTAAS